MSTLVIAADDDGRRIDLILRKSHPNVPPGQIARAIRTGSVRVNGARATNEHRVATGDRVTAPDWKHPGRPTRSVRDGSPRDHRQSQPAVRAVGNRILAGDFEVPIIDRTDDFLVVAKPAGLVSHGRGGLDELVRSVARQRKWWNESVSFRPGPVHRLDYITSGVQVFALSLRGAREFSAQARAHRTRKLYLTVVDGALKLSRTVDVPLAYDRSARRAVPQPVEGSSRLRFLTARTELYPLATDARGTRTLAAACPVTGRTHQIRCHVASIGHPLVGDGLYGGKGNEDPFLHATVLSLPRASEHSDAPESSTTWFAPVPTDAFSRLRATFGEPSRIRQRVSELVDALGLDVSEDFRL